MRTRYEPFRFVSCLSVLVMDWAMYVSTMTMHGSWSRAWLLSTVIGSAVTLFAVAGIEARAPGDPKHSLYRGLAAALVVASPLPVLGTLVALVCAVWGVALKREQARAWQSAEQTKATGVL